jgi:hypothetical protein
VPTSAPRSATSTSTNLIHDSRTLAFENRPPGPSRRPAASAATAPSLAYRPQSPAVIPRLPRRPRLGHRPPDRPPRGHRRPASPKSNSSMPAPTTTPRTPSYWSTNENKLYPIRPVTARLKWFHVHPRRARLRHQHHRRHLTASRSSASPSGPRTRRSTRLSGARRESNPPQHAEFPPRLPECPVPHRRRLPTVDPTIQDVQQGRPRVLRALLPRDRQHPAARRPIRQHAASRTSKSSARTWRFSDRLIVSSNAVIGHKPHRSRPTSDYSRQERLRLQRDCPPTTGPVTERAYDRPTRLGPILPVNLDTPAASDDLVVVWYAGSTGSASPGCTRPVQYSLAWPSDTEVSAASSSPAARAPGRSSTLTYPSRRVYNQPDPVLSQATIPTRSTPCSRPSN